MQTTHSPDRIALKKITPDVSAAMGVLHARAVDAAHEAGLEPDLLELVRVRASQINGCAFCLDLHTRDALAVGESPQRLFLLDAWRESPGFSDRERAALAITEAVTLIHDGHLPDDVYAHGARVFTEAELAAVVWAAVVINAYNRIAISTRMVPAAPHPTAAPPPTAVPHPAAAPDPTASPVPASHAHH